MVVVVVAGALMLGLVPQCQVGKAEPLLLRRLRSPARGALAGRPRIGLAAMAGWLAGWLDAMQWTIVRSMNCMLRNRAAAGCHATSARA
eukprot:COSAG04_NODE_148_length_22826_cov_11.360026_16_plen_89_part_00